MLGVRATALSNYVEVAESVGLDPYAMLRRVNIDPAMIEEKEHPIDAGAVAMLLEDSAEISGCMAFGLLMAERRSLWDLGAISLLLKNSATAREVIESLVAYQHVVGNAITLTIEACGDARVLRTDVLTRRYRRQSTELLMGVTHCAIAEAAGGGWCPETAHFMHCAPEDLSVHNRIFGCSLHFGDWFNGFTCSNSALETANAEAVASAADHARRYLDLLQPHPTAAPVSVRLARALQSLLPMGRVTLNQAARSMGLHPRTLQRELATEGLSFAALLDKARRELALRYLANPTIAIGSVGSLIGYSSPSSFTRWFAAEFGQSPAAWRTAQRPNASDTEAAG